ncbi:putative sugar phosphate transporter domain-containing protein [Lupinus albus]|uniref:Putative sugar phosphate transporter domain-containing protein n=1 Tax=Lupinus albus TaxID=3870 RepID=A0A6A4NHK7_LUPAL|nr:putative sugar phosphate transporter domain-containing protein [Lupinus albus]
MGKDGSVSDGVLKKIILSYTYVSIWIFLSFTVIVYNKYILDKKLYNWSFPISLTMIHMSFCASLAFLLVRVFRVVEPVSMSRELYLTSVVPIGALYSLSLWLSNSAYIYLSVSFIQMLKALMPVAVYSIGVMLKKENYKNDTMFNMLSISLGVAVAAYGEARFDTWGVILQLGAVAFEATRLTSALTMNVAGVVKDWLLIAFSWSVIKDTVTPINLFGYGLAFLGVAYYNHAKLQAMKAKEAQKKVAQSDEETGRLLEEREGDGTGKRIEQQNKD